MRIYLPPDANCLLSVWDHCLHSRNYVNVVIASKYKAPQWLSIDEALKHCTAGIGKWHWASNDGDSEPDVVMACCGDVPTLETLAAVSILRKHMPELKVRVVNVVDLMKLQPASEHPHGLNDLDRFHLVMDTIDRLPQTGDTRTALKQQLTDKLQEHYTYIREYGLDMPEIRNWKWTN